MIAAGGAVPAGSPDQSGELEPLLRVDALSKQFPGVLALDAVDFDLQAGEVHVLFGENGATMERIYISLKILFVTSHDKVPRKSNTVKLTAQPASDLDIQD